MNRKPDGVSEKEHREFLDSIREGAFYDWIAPGKPWATNDEYFDERYYNNPSFPQSDDSEKKIQAFIEDALEAEKAIITDLRAEGFNEDEEDIICEACQWPLREDAPMDAVRAYLRYVEEDAEAEAKGLIID